jgi:hypothetical protein
LAVVGGLVGGTVVGGTVAGGLLGRGAEVLVVLARDCPDPHAASRTASVSDNEPTPSLVARRTVSIGG